MESNGRYNCLKVYLTGFGPFRNFTHNPSEELVLSIIRNQSKFNTQKSSLVSADIYEVNTCFVNNNLMILHKKIEDDNDKSNNTNTLNILIHFGLYAIANDFNIECQATNYIKDEYQACPITHDTQLCLNTILDYESLISKLKSKGQQCTLSHNAGTYLCNYIYFLSLSHFIKHNNVIVLFIHIPQFSIMTLEEDEKWFKALLESLEEIYC